MELSRKLRGALTIALLCAATSVVGCANYQFEQARRADGTWDIHKLTRDLAASGADKLYQGVWIPLIYADLTVFTRRDPAIQGGYTLDELQGYGPAFLVGSATRTSVDGLPEAVDQQEAWWVIWGYGVKFDQERTATESGTRVRDEWRALLLFQGEDLHYRPVQRREGAGH